MANYDHQKIEQKWQKIWAEREIYKSVEPEAKPKYYVLDMFPYPSGEGLHVGHPKGYIATDIISRFQRRRGFNVLHPMGWDAFGLPAENYALKNKVHPRAAVEKNIARFKEQLALIGFDYDWSREINTTDSDYYKWTQWIFLQLYKKGLAYQSNEPVNWCPSCQTVLSNEDLESGKCERCGSMVEKRPMRQWVLKITAYADRLLQDLEKLDWPESIKESQKNWIGKSEGAEIEFKISPAPDPLPEGEGEKPNYLIFHSVFKPSPWGREGWGYETADPKLYCVLQEKALEMRKNPTAAEDLLWQVLRNNSMDYHFRRQHIVGRFVVDFVCLEKKLVIEVDGDIHDYQKENDAERTIFLEQNGFEVIRFKNEEVINDIKSVKIKIDQVLKALSLGEGLGGASVKVFTTRADTIFGVTYLVLAPEHGLVQELKPQIKNWPAVEKYLEKIKNKTEIERTTIEKDKTGVPLAGIFATNPANGEKLPVWIADYVLADYGTGAVMAVPAHDERDWQFAEKFNLPIIDRPLVPVSEAIKKFGRVQVTYKLHDWVFSRQRYWGEPIPIIHCEKCHVVPVPEKDLPVKLPEVKSYQPTGTGESPLANIPEWVNTTCPKCGGPAKRETNTMPQWAGSSWYYLRYEDPKNSTALVDQKKEKYWSPVDLYVGGAEHATRHLIYARFWHKFLFDLGVVSCPEPFQRLQNVGLIMAEDGRKMSKRYGNVINPDEIVKLYGADTLRLYEMFLGPFDQSVTWSPEALIGPRRFLERVWKLSSAVERPDFARSRSGNAKSERQTASLLQQTIQKVTADVEALKFNTAISALMILVNFFEKNGLNRADYEILLKLLAPFAPHLTEELWSDLGQNDSIHLSPWPIFSSQEITVDKLIIIQINGIKRAELLVSGEVSEAEITAQALALPVIQKKIAGQKIKRQIYVPGRLLNFVVSNP